MTEMQAWLLALGVFLLLVLLYISGRMPSTEAFHEFANILNSRGGNILILSGFSVYFAVQSLKLFYRLFELEHDGVIKQDDAFALMGLQFVTSSMFGSAFGALLKTMSGESSKARAGDTNGNGNGNGKGGSDAAVHS